MSRIKSLEPLLLALENIIWSNFICHCKDYTKDKMGWNICMNQVGFM